MRLSFSEEAKRIRLVLFVLFLINFSFSSYSQVNNSSKFEVTPVVQELSDWVESYRAYIEKKFGVSEIYLGGGTVLNILDHVYDGAPVSMRDVDLYVVLPFETNIDLAWEVGYDLEKEGLGVLMPEHVRPKPPHSYFNAKGEVVPTIFGYGFYLKNKDKMLDVYLYHDAKAFDSAGPMNVDTVKMKLTKDRTIVNLLKEVSKSTPEELHKKGITYDPREGYMFWRNKMVRFSHTSQILYQPLSMSMRVVRTFGKLNNFEIPEDVADFIENAMATSTFEDHYKVTSRTFLKVLADKIAGQEVYTLSQLGVISNWLPELGLILQDYSAAELTELFDISEAERKSRGEKLELLRLEKLFDLMPPLIQDRYLNDFAGWYPEWVEMRKEAISCVALLAS